MKTNYIYVLLCLIFIGCSNERIDEQNSSEDSLEVSSQKNHLKTIPIDETLKFLENLKTEHSANNFGRNSSDILLDVDILSLVQVDVEHTNAQLNVANATTKYDILETQFLQIEIDGNVETILYHHLPKTASNPLIQNDAFNGDVISTDLQGNVLSAFSIQDSELYGQYDLGAMSGTNFTDPCWGIGCGLTLDQIVITAPSTAPTSSVNPYFLDYSNYYQWTRSVNNFNTLGTAYASYYFNQAVREFNDKDVWDEEQDYTDEWNRLTECEKDFFKSVPEALYLAVGNRKEAQRAAFERFGNCLSSEPNGNPMRNTVGDAYRHAYFAALNTHNMGYTNAKALGDAHECETKPHEMDEMQMDLHNNSWGYLYGDTVSVVYEEQFYNSFMHAYNSGEIHILADCL